MEKSKILILGAGIYAEEVADLVFDCQGCTLEGFIDEFIPAGAGILKMGLPVMTLVEATPFAASHLMICGVGGRKRMSFIRRASAAGFQFTTLIHPSATISRSTTIKAGATIRAGCVIAANTIIGEHVTINRGCLIGHDVVIDDFALLSPGVNIAGRTRIGAGTEVGMSAILVDNIRVGQYCIIGAGSLVNRDVPDLVQAVGMPAQIIRKLDPVE